MRDHVLAIDQGTTGTTVLVLDRNLGVKARVNREFPQIYPRPGWVEHDPEAIWRSAVEAIGEAVTRCGLDTSRLAAVGITNQRETVVVWERSGGRPVHPAIVWQCRRTAADCDVLRDRGLEGEVAARTGLLLDPYFSATKVAWILDHVAGARTRAEAGDLAFGTVDSFLVWRLTGGAVHATDVTNASRTLLMDLDRCAWDDRLLEVFGVPRALLPEIRGSSEVVGYTRGVPGLPDGIPVAGVAGDQQAALFGQACFRPGEAKCTYGTGAFVLLNVGDRPVRSRNRLLSTVAWRVGGRTTYALEGSAFIAGAVVQWLRDGLGVIARSGEVEALAATVPDSGGVVFVPALVGLGAPHWRPEARGIIRGITRGTTLGHIARAALEGIAFQVRDILEAMAGDAGLPVAGLKVDGGAAANDLLLQFQADLIRCPIVRPAMLETTALGAAFLAGLAVGLWKDQEVLLGVFPEERRFLPSLDPARAEALVAAWREAVARA